MACSAAIDRDFIGRDAITFARAFVVTLIPREKSHVVPILPDPRENALARVGDKTSLFSVYI